MRAVGYQKSLPIENEAALTNIDLPRPEPKGRDLLVQIQAVSVNPVDTKIRKRTGAGPEPWKVLGWDAAGIVRETGPEATLFKAGDAVFYAGTIGRRTRTERLGAPPDHRAFDPDRRSLGKDPNRRR